MVPLPPTKILVLATLQDLIKSPSFVFLLLFTIAVPIILYTFLVKKGTKRFYAIMAPVLIFIIGCAFICFAFLFQFNRYFINVGP